jgi:putative SOS response-associated peptidase YedK
VTGGRKPINAKSETVERLPTLREAYRKWRCILPVDGFFEWKAIKGAKTKQPYAIAMKMARRSGLGELEGELRSGAKNFPRSGVESVV